MATSLLWLSRTVRRLKIGSSPTVLSVSLNASKVGIYVDGVVKPSRFTTVNLEVNDGERLHAWIDYSGSSTRLEVRLSKSDTSRSRGFGLMGSPLPGNNWPSYDPHNFSQIRPSDPSHPSDRIFPGKWSFLVKLLIRHRPLIILLIVGHFHPQIKLRPKRAASDNLISEHDCKLPRGSLADGSS
ncbi:hypothetical protein QJS04_geneDACA011565 [Acorus gramineus]|uniref:DET1- and DDB1-associated protein 1 domain-containing protein n=1 Tax=Acorus gramineus TaxID=55184 RepID=A0AAV9ADW9_ACOGR|nr:hypothetical protein QJS04_geneDACA011565 [Acorus gramineus]